MSELHINNRRYVGSKTSLLDHIDATIREFYDDYDSAFTFADYFAGTGVVSEYYFKKNKNVIVNDLLMSNYYAYLTWISNDYYDQNKVNSLIEGYNRIDAFELKDNYFSNIYGDKYFSKNMSKKIGFIRDEIESQKSKLTKREFAILLTSLIYAADKIANTVGHFEHYLANKPENENFEMRFPTINEAKAKSCLYHQDANVLVKRTKSDIAYIDPPYNARQYVNFYHVLENLAIWNKPTEFEGSSMKFKRNHLKSDYSKTRAPEVFKDLISNIVAKLIIVSYNNTYNARSSASNNKISEHELVKILKQKGKVTIKEFGHKHFNSGKTDFKNHKEKLYVCEVRNG